MTTCETCVFLPMARCSVVLILLMISTTCQGAGIAPESPSSTEGNDSCMRKWLKIAGASTNDLPNLEEKARLYHLSESKVLQEHTAILNVLLPGNIAERLKTCVGNVSACGQTTPCVAGQCAYNETTDRHVCQCPAGLIGERCQTDIDECATGQHDCDITQRAVCNNTHGSFFCHCRHGYCGEKGQLCEDVDECLKGTHRCHGNATCRNTVGSYNCSCVDGFIGDGLRCEEILCTEKNKESKLCREVESLREQLTVIPQLKKELSDQKKQLSMTNNTIITLSRALGNFHEIENRCRGIAAWQNYPWVNWEDSRDAGQLRNVTYTKQRNDTTLRVAFYTTMLEWRHDRCSEWYIKLAGQECTQPAPISSGIYTWTSDQSDPWTMRPAEISGFCSGTSSGRIPPGPLTISVHVRGCSEPAGDAHTGKYKNQKVTSSLVVEEYCP